MKILTHYARVLTRYAKVPFLCILIISACTTQDVITLEIEEQPSSSFEEDQLSLGRILSNSLKNADLRILIKNEANLKFDGDYDVLLQKIKYLPLKDGRHVLEVLQEETSENVDELLDRLPLATIFIPEFDFFSHRNWNTELIIPRVAVRLNSLMMENRIKIIDSEGADSIFPLDVIPDFPVIVLKTNEMLEMTNSVSSKEEVLSYGKFRFKRIPEDYSLTGSGNESDGRTEAISSTIKLKKQKTNSAMRGAYSSWKSSLCVNNDCYQRDYLYYGIKPIPNISKGPFNANYTEAITSIKFKNSAAVQAASNDWTEGFLELYFDIFFIGGSNALTSTRKVVSLNVSDLTNSSGNPNAINFSNPISVTEWDMQKYGDRWVVKVYEFDPSATISTSRTNQTSKGTNYQFDVGFGQVVKVGVGFGGQSSSTLTRSTTVTYTTASNQLGESIISWFDPSLASGGGSTYYPFIYDTGSIQFTMVAIHKSEL